MKTEAFLDILEARELVSAKIIGKLREKIADSDRQYTAKSVLKYLVKKELLTHAQAKQLLETTLTVSTHAESSILGKIPLPKTPAEQAKSSSVISDDADIPVLPPIEKEPVKKPFEDEGLSEETRRALTSTDQEAALTEKPDALSESFLASVPEAQADPFGEIAEDEKQPDPRKIQAKKKKKKQKNKNEWDSPLLLFGGGGLVLLIVAGAALMFLLNHEDADAILSEASEYFDGGSYTQAIKQYERFVGSHKNHPEFSQAKVRLGMARLWQAVEGNSNYTAALETAQQILDDIQDEPKFNLAQEDLASLLPRIAEGLANLAEQEDDLDRIQQHVEHSNTTISLCLNTKFIPKGFRNDALLESVKETLHRVEQNREQNAALAQAMSDIDQAIGQQDTAAAYAIHKGLLKEFSTLYDNASLAAKVRQISAAEHSGIEFREESIAAETTEPHSNIQSSVALAQRRGPPAADAQGVVAFRVDGAIYSLDARDGSLLWRKFAGMAVSSTPVMLPGGDILVVDTVRNELQRIVGRTGKLVWRQGFDAPILRPVLLEKRLLVAEESGKLYVLDSISGKRTGYVQFSQAASAPPTVNLRRKRIYLLGSHSSIFTLSTEDFSCLGVYYLGHSQGGVLAPAVSVLNKLIVAENTGVKTGRLHVLMTDKQGLLTKEVASKRLDGLVTTALLTSKRQVVSVTTAGQATVFEVGASDDASAFTQLARRDAVAGPAVARYGAMHEGHLWLAGTGLNKLAIMPTGNRLPVIDLDHNYTSDVFDSPLLTVGNFLLHLRRPQNEAGVMVAAMDTATGKATWETALAVPPAGPPVVDSDSASIAVATTSGAFYSIDREVLGRRVQDSALRLSGRNRGIPPLTQAIDLGAGRMALAAVGSDVLLHYSPGADNPGPNRKPIQKIRLAGPLSCRPLAWQNGLVVPTTLGQVFLLDAESAKSSVAPFQPALSPGTSYHWLTPASLGSGEDSRLILSDGKNKIYLLRLASQPQPHLLAEVEAKLNGSPLNTKLCVFAGRACAGSEDSHLAIFELPSLASQAAVELGGNVVWGPHASGDRLLLATDADQLVCLDEAYKIAWRQPLAHGRLVGGPVQAGDDRLILSSSGRLSRISLADGNEQTFLAAEEPVVAGPVLLGNRFVLSSHDGTLLIVESP